MLINFQHCQFFKQFVTNFISPFCQYTSEAELNSLSTGALEGGHVL